jgi:hypothetical protein
VQTSSSIRISARAEGAYPQPPSRGAVLRRRLLLALPCTALLLAACVKQPLAQTAPQSGSVEVLSTELAQHIVDIAEKSPTFRAAWERIAEAGVPISIGTDAQLRDELPSWYRNNPRNWAGVTVAKGAEGSLSSVVVALSVDAMKQIADGAAYMGDYFTGELDRVLIHEIYGHVVPVVEARDMSKGCPDAVEEGETQSCVAKREAQIAAEIERGVDVTTTRAARDSQPLRSQALPPRKR